MCLLSVFTDAALFVSSDYQRAGETVTSFLILYLVILNDVQLAPPRPAIVLIMDKTWLSALVCNYKDGSVYLD